MGKDRLKGQTWWYDIQCTCDVVILIMNLKLSNQIEK